MKKYTTNEVMKKVGISRTGLSFALTGRIRQSTKKSKPYEIPPILEEGTDYERLMERGRAKIYYFQSAIAILKRVKDVKITVLPKEDRTKHNEPDYELQDKLNANFDHLEDG